MGLPEGADVVHAVYELTTRLGLPTGLDALGVTADMYDAIIKDTLADHGHKTNRRQRRGLPVHP